MSIIEANIVINSEGDDNIEMVIAQINELLQGINNKSSQVNINYMDDPMSNNPINYRPGV